jgi:chorismate synthase
MNVFGRLFRVTIFGESHGPGVGVLIDGCPAGLTLSPADLEPDLARRRPGRAGTTERVEVDLPLLQSGVFEGRATGAPLAIWFENQDVDSAAYDRIRITPRPGHADMTAHGKYGGYHDHRGGGHFSGRLTVGLVAAGAIARRLMPEVSIDAELIQVGGRSELQAAVDEAAAASDSVGGLVECIASGLPVGLGEPFFDSLESLLAHGLFAIGGVRGVEFGAGFECARMRGSQCNDAILDATGRTASNHAGGINGGISNGNQLVFRVAVKPTSSIGQPQQTVDLSTGAAAELSVGGRHDACIALRVPVVVEAVCAIVLADLMLLEQRIPRIWE